MRHADDSRQQRRWRGSGPAAIAVLAVAAIALPPALARAGEAPATSGSGVAHVRIYAPRGGVGPNCDRVRPLARRVAAPAVLAGALRALLRGPSAAERRRGYGGWFSRRTAGMLRSVYITGHVAHVDFADFSRRIPNASTSCGSALLLAQLDRTATQFPTVRRAVYSFGGDVGAFYEWLQRSPPAAAR